MTDFQRPQTEAKESSERVFALDALRAIMMLLGLVLHAAVTYMVYDEPSWSLKDSNTDPLFDLVKHFIHSFRMPVFFVAAGYFGALLFYKKGPKAMLLNRFKRIVLPFAAGVFITWPLVVFAFVFTRAAFSHSPSPLRSAIDTLVTGNFLPFNVAHLWFLYFLMMYAVLGWLLGLLFQKKTNFTAFVNHALTKIFQSFPLRLLGMTVALFLCLYWMESSNILTNNYWSIDPAIFVTYFVFFFTGWVLYKTNSLQHVKQYPIIQLSIATLLLLIENFAVWPSESSVLIARQGLSAVYSSLFIFGFISFFMYYFNSYSSRLSYIMDAAYCVYIIHLPIIAFIPGLMAGLDLPAFLKFAITLVSTSTISFLIYHYFVRGTFMGMFLNGKVYKKNSLTPVTT